MTGADTAGPVAVVRIHKHELDTRHIGGNGSGAGCQGRLPRPRTGGAGVNGGIVGKGAVIRKNATTDGKQNLENLLAEVVICLAADDLEVGEVISGRKVEG